MIIYINYEKLLFHVERFFEVYNPFTAQSLNDALREYQLSAGYVTDIPCESVPLPCSATSKEEQVPPSPIAELQLSQSFMSSAAEVSVSETVPKRNPLMTPGSILSWENMKKWELFVQDNIQYLKLESYIYGMFIIVFVSAPSFLNPRSWLFCHRISSGSVFPPLLTVSPQ